MGANQPTVPERAPAGMPEPPTCPECGLIPDTGRATCLTCLRGGATGPMSEAEGAEIFARINAARAAEEDARRAAITPHVRKAPKRKPPRMSGPRYFNLMRAMERNPEQYADFRPTNYCGAPLTTEDWEKRSALAKKNAALVVTAGVCADCLRLAREDSSTRP